MKNEQKTTPPASGEKAPSVWASVRQSAALGRLARLVSHRPVGTRGAGVGESCRARDVGRPGCRRSRLDGIGRRGRVGELTRNSSS